MSRMPEWNFSKRWERSHRIEYFSTVKSAKPRKCLVNSAMSRPVFTSRRGGARALRTGDTRLLWAEELLSGKGTSGTQVSLKSRAWWNFSSFLLFNVFPCSCGRCCQQVCLQVEWRLNKSERDNGKMDWGRQRARTMSHCFQRHTLLTVPAPFCCL